MIFVPNNCFFFFMQWILFEFLRTPEFRFCGKRTMVEKIYREWLKPAPFFHPPFFPTIFPPRKPRDRIGIFENVKHWTNEMIFNAQHVQIEFTYSNCVYVEQNESRNHENQLLLPKCKTQKAMRPHCKKRAKIDSNWNIEILRAIRPIYWCTCESF